MAKAKGKPITGKGKVVLKTPKSDNRTISYADVGAPAGKTKTLPGGQHHKPRSK